MVGLLLLAGGQSKRMGQDKARMAGAFEGSSAKPKRPAWPPHCACWPKPRGDELVREGWTKDADVVMDDPAHATCLHDVLVHAFNGDLPSVVLAPCDAVAIDRTAFRHLAGMEVGVPLDHTGRRQVLFSRLPEGWVAVSDAKRRVEALFDTFDGHRIEPVAAQLVTINTPEEFEASQSDQRRSVKRDGP